MKPTCPPARRGRLQDWVTSVMFLVIVVISKIDCLRYTFRFLVRILAQGVVAGGRGRGSYGPYYVIARRIFGNFNVRISAIHFLQRRI